jgi:two-component system sensor histidine kinase GlrK
MRALIDQFLALNQQIFSIISSDSSQYTTLSIVQKNFELLDLQGQLLEKRNVQLISLQAGELQLEAFQVSTVILQSLIVVPIALVIAIVFFNLITRPLRQLEPQIKQLADGHFDREIAVQGSQEITQIAETLESMRVRLRALELQKSSFIRHISHELKTPLATIREGVELLYDNSVGSLNREQQEINSIIRASVVRLQKLIEDLLNFNIVLDSTSLQDKQQVDLIEVVKLAINDRKLDIKRKKLKLKLTSPKIGLISNRQHLRVIIENLLSNAIKYAPERSQIFLQGEINNKHLFFTLSDQGPGISDTHKDKIFDAFFQGTQPTNSVIKSSGLGLTIVKELVMRLNGNVRLLDSTVGASFQIILPHAKLHNQNYPQRGSGE